jgi:hypothetical protein
MHHRKDDDTPHNSDTDLTHLAIVVAIVLIRAYRPSGHKADYLS